MVLRPDEPLLDFYERPFTRDKAKDVAVRNLDKDVPTVVDCRRSSRRDCISGDHEIMGIVATVLFINVLWRASATRKVRKKAHFGGGQQYLLPDLRVR